MLKENDFTESIIQLINSMPEKEREKIARKITARTKPKRKIKGGRKNSFEEMSKFLDSLGSRLPADYKFNREEANER